MEDDSSVDRSAIFSSPQLEHHTDERTVSKRQWCDHENTVMSRSLRVPWYKVKPRLVRRRFCPGYTLLNSCA